MNAPPESPVSAPPRAETTRRDLLAVLLVGLAAIPFARWISRREGKWPQRPIELVVFSSPGGGLDLACRTLAAAMGETLGAEIRVSNMTGGRGGVAAHYVYGRVHDGYRWLGVTEAMLSLAVRGSHPTTSDDWHPFVLAGSPGVISVPPQSRFQQFPELLEEIRRSPGRLTIAASGRGSIWQLRTEILRRHAGFDVRYIPYDGSGPSQLAALGGEVDLVLTALAEQLPLIQGGRLRPLVAVEPGELELAPATRIPAITSFLPELQAHLPLPQWLGFLLPQDTPPDVLATVERAFHAALRSPALRDFLASGRYEVHGLTGAAARRMIRRSESVVNWLMFEQGLVTRSPADFGIPPPSPVPAQ